MNVAVVGCLHGKLEFLYEELKEWEIKTNKKVDFIVCCGDFQVSSPSFHVSFLEYQRQDRPDCFGMSPEIQRNGLIP